MGILTQEIMRFLIQEMIKFLSQEINRFDILRKSFEN